MIRTLTLFAALLLAAPLTAQEAPKPAEAPAKPFVYTPKATDVVIGKTTAPVVIVEYASLSCPHCAHFFKDVLPQVTTKYIDTGKAQLVYRDYPLNAPALKAAVLVQCADKDRRHAFLKVLFSTQDKWAYVPDFQASLAGVAALGGVERKKFDACLADKKLEETILKVAKEAQNDYKVDSTPSFFINNVRMTGDHSVEAMSKAIDEALAVGTKK